jgi:hypothetical protein
MKAGTDDGRRCCRPTKANLEHGGFRWPPISDGIMRLTASQLAALVDEWIGRASTRAT